MDLRELRRQNGGNFGAGENTGSIGVCTLDMPRLAYLAKDEEDFYKRLDALMDIAARGLKTRRTVVTKLLEEGFYPYLQHYLGSFKNYFSTIGLVGMNEACENANWIGENMLSEKSQKFTIDVLNHMRTRLSDYQEKYGDLYNLEATPAEASCSRLAKHDKEKYPDIITANDHGDPYYTNSSHLPVNATDDLFEALDIEDPMQVLYTSGTVFHAFLGERLPNWKSAAMLVKKIAENYRLPYFTLSPTYSVCPDHGYINGEVYKCPKCGKETEVYSRITGYYRPVKNWNDGKAQEFKDRKTYSMGIAVKAVPHQYDDLDIEKEIQQVPVMIEQDNDHKENGHFKDDTDHIMLFTTKTCPNCKIIKEWLKNHNVDYSMIDAEENPELCEKYGIMQAPTMVISSNGGFKVYENVSNIIRHFQQD